MAARPCSPDWLKLWNFCGGPSRHGSAEGLAQSLDIIRPMSPDNLRYGQNMLRTRGISAFIHELKGPPVNPWCIDRNSERLPTLLYLYANAGRVGALWNLYAHRLSSQKNLSGRCLGYGFLIWAYFIYSALGAEAEAQECGQLLALEIVRDQERCGLLRGQKAHYDLAMFLHAGVQGDELNLLEPMLPMTQQENWQDPAKVIAAVKAHAYTRGEQFVHDAFRWTWPATLYALARRANALELLPRENPFLCAPLDVAQVDTSEPMLETFRTLEDRYRTAAS